jgi:hypothetical protein
MTSPLPSIDEIARSRHADALAHLSPAVRLRLRPRARVRSTSRRPWSLPFAGALAALFALAIGMQWRSAPPPTRVAATPAAVASTATPATPAAGNATNTTNATPATAQQTPAAADMPAAASAPVITPSQVVASAAPTQAAGNADITADTALPAALASLEEPPEFYQWLGDQDDATLSHL